MNSGRGGIHFGPRRDQPPGVGGAPPLSKEREAYGYEFEQDRRRALDLKQKQAKAAKPKVEPWVLVAVAGALVFLGLVVVYKASSAAPSDSMGYENQQILSEYAKYVGSQGGRGLPTPDQVRRELNTITWLENVGRSGEARRELQQVMKEQNDPASPVYQLALERLRNSP